MYNKRFSGSIRAVIDDVVYDLPSTACTDIFARVRHTSVMNIARDFKKIC